MAVGPVGTVFHLHRKTVAVAAAGLLLGGQHDLRIIAEHGIHRPQVLFRRFRFQQRLQRHRLFDAVFTGRDPAQFCHTSPAAQGFADVLAQCTDISTLGTADPQADALCLHTQKSQLMDGDGPGLAFHFPALPR